MLLRFITVSALWFKSVKQGVITDISTLLCAPVDVETILFNSANKTVYFNRMVYNLMRPGFHQQCFRYLPQGSEIIQEMWQDLKFPEARNNYTHIIKGGSMEISLRLQNI